MRELGLVWIVVAFGCGHAGKDKYLADSGASDTDTDTDTDSDTDTDPTACTVFPADNPWNADVSGLDVLSNSDAYLGEIGLDGHLHPDFGTTYNGAPNGIPYVDVDDSVAKVLVAFDYADESDVGPYPLPPDAPIEGGPNGDGDRHVIAFDTSECKLYELFNAHPKDDGTWHAGSGAIFDLTSNDLRPEGRTSADAAGLPIYPGLVRYDEVVTDGVIDHALRFTVQHSQKGYIHPATHYASSCKPADCPTYAPMGLRVRMKKDYDCSSLSSEVQVLCTAFKKYGMIVADNGSNWYVSGAPDDRWSDDNLHDLSKIPGSAFEAVNTGAVLP